MTSTYTDHQVAQWCGVSVEVLADWRCLGVGPPWFAFGPVVVYPAERFWWWVQVNAPRWPVVD